MNKLLVIFALLLIAASGYLIYDRFFAPDVATDESTSQISDAEQMQMMQIEANKQNSVQHNNVLDFDSRDYSFIEKR